jgi:hypothetical protein
LIAIQKALGVPASGAFLLVFVEAAFNQVEEGGDRFDEDQ